MNSKRKGNITEAAILTEFIKRGIPVLLPFGDNERYDMVIEVNGDFKRIQCKTGRYRNGCVNFQCCSSQAHRGKGYQSYKDDIDYFAVYCEELNLHALVPIELSKKTEAHLRVENTKNLQTKNIVWFSDFSLDKQLENIYSSVAQR